MAVYERYCRQKGVAAYPVRAEAVSPFLADRALVRGLKTHNLGDTLSDLRCHAAFLGVPLPPGDDALVKEHVRLLCASAPSVEEHGRTLPLAELLATVDQMRATGGALARQALALLLTLVLYQSRGVEILDGGTQFRDLIFCAWGVARRQFLDKTRKRTLDSRSKAALCMPEGADGLSALCLRRALLDHFQSDSDWTETWAQDSKRGRWPVFSCMRLDGQGRRRCTATPLSGRDGMGLLMPFFVAAGVKEPETLSLHFGRHAGTHLYTVYLHLDGPFTNGLGGWAADKRKPDIMHAHYLTLGPEELVATGHAKIRDSGGRQPLHFCCSPKLIG